MDEIYLVFYKKKRKVNNLKTLWYRFADDFTRLITLGKYSHCELAIKNNDGTYFCYSSSLRDRGVRFKVMPLPNNEWDFLDVSNLTSRPHIEHFFLKTDDMQYDLLGLISPVFGNIHDKDKYFCSEWCAELLGLKEPNKISPNSLFRLINKK